MKTTTTLPRLATLFLALLLPLLSHAQTAAASHPPLPRVNDGDTKAYAFIWDGSAWQLLPRNEARILGDKSDDTKKQLTGTLRLDGCYAVPVVSGENIQLVFRSHGKIKTYKGQREGEYGVEVMRLDCKPGEKPGTLIRTAQLQRLGEAAATFGDNRESIAVTKYETPEGHFWVVQLTTALAPGRYAFYLTDRAFEFEVK